MECVSRGRRISRGVQDSLDGGYFYAISDICGAVTICMLFSGISRTLIINAACVEMSRDLILASCAPSRFVSIFASCHPARSNRKDSERARDHLVRLHGVIYVRMALQLALALLSLIRQCSGSSVFIVPIDMVLQRNNTAKCNVDSFSPVPLIVGKVW